MPKPRTHHPRRAASLVAIAALLAGLAACTSDTGSDATAERDAVATTEATSTTTSQTPEPFEGGDFFTVPDPLPEGDHGTLLRYEPLDESFEGATGYRIMYLSESLAGEPIAVTGLASVPTAAAPEGGRRTVTIAHGTTGIADECAPSVRGRNAEMTLVGNQVADEYLIAATDYEGLGTPGRHPYLVGESEGRSTMDAALAAAQLPDADASDQVAIMGYSQGGHGALWANQVAAEWTPELEVVGTFAGAPATEIGVILGAASNVKGFAMMVIAGIKAAHPEADLAEVLTPKGLEVIEAVDEGCAPQTFAAVADFDGDEIFAKGGSSAEPWATLAAEQDAGTEKTNDAPVLVIRSNQDPTVPAFFIDQLMGRMCANEQVVERRDLDEGGHTEAAVPAYDQAIEWMEARFGDEGPAAISTCA